MRAVAGFTTVCLCGGGVRFHVWGTTFLGIAVGWTTDWYQLWGRCTVFRVLSQAPLLLGCRCYVHIYSNGYRYRVPVYYIIPVSLWYTGILQAYSASLGTEDSGCIHSPAPVPAHSLPLLLPSTSFCTVGTRARAAPMRRGTMKRTPVTNAAAMPTSWALSVSRDSHSPVVWW